MMKDAGAVEFAKDIEAYVRSRFGYKRVRASVDGRNIDVNMRKVSLYLRFKPHDPRWPRHTLVIARISFDKIHKGQGTAFLGWLKNVAAKHTVQFIGIEQTHTEAIRAFCRKYKFTLIPDPNKNENWFLSVDALPVVKIDIK